ncbi:MAG: RNA polymerase sigma factor [Chloroflexi bacterium]|nr:RNA polymerase sigma factor [Chloroflexota bacterium]
MYERTVRPVYRYAIALVHDEGEAEDVTAEVYLRAWRMRHSYRGNGSETSWLLSIAHNVAVSSLRGNSVAARTTPFVLEHGDASTEDPAEIADRGPGNERLADALHHLTGEQRQVIFLRFFEGLSHDEVAHRLAMNPNAVRAVQFRALHRLRRLMEATNASTA